jgi:hypothetical protein
MNDFESLKKDFKAMFPNLTDEQIEKQARFMADKYATIKTGPNVIHLDYFGGLITDIDIHEIENNISNIGLELSHFDKNGVPYAALDDFTLQIAFFLNNPDVTNVILGISAGALWDTIKNTSIFVWRKLKDRYWIQQQKGDKQSKKINFGLHIKLDNLTSVNLKLNGEQSEETVLKALDKMVDLIKEIKMNETPKPSKFYQINGDGDWQEVNIKEEIMKEYLKNKNNGR